MSSMINDGNAEIFEIKEYEMQEIQKQLKNSASKIETISNNMLQSFSNITSTGLLNRSTTLINNQMNKIMENLDNTGNAVSLTYDNIANVETTLTSKANDILVPQDFVKNDTSYTINMSSGLLDKKDGKQINYNNNTSREEIDFNNSLDYNEKLKSIIKTYEEQYEKTDNYTTKKTNLNVLKTDGTLINDNIEDSKIKNESLDELNENKVSIEDIEINNTMNKKDLEMINDNGVLIDDNINDYNIKEKILEQINKDINEIYPELNESFELTFVNLERIINDENLILLNNFDELYMNVRKIILESLQNGKFELKKYNE